MMNVFIYKTNISSHNDLKAVERALVSHHDITRWSVDRDDVDKVLRVESTIGDTADIAKIIQKAGYDCEELPV